MRKAEIDHAWQGCRNENTKEIRITSLTISEGNTPYTIPIKSRITALLGENGSGKTNILRAISNAIVGAASVTPGFNHALTVNGYFRGQQLGWTTSSPRTSDSPSLDFFDPSADVHVQRSQLLNTITLGEEILQYDQKILSSKDLEIYKLVCCRAYKRIGIRELESRTKITSTLESTSEEINEDVFPYFEVELYNGSKYDSISMGLGELSACYLVWRLSRVKKGSIILIDEPDSHLSPKSRIGLTNYLAWVASEYSCWILFTSHSSEPIQQFLENEILFLERADIATHRRLDTVNNKHGAMVKLGMTFSRRFLIIVEDVDAMEVVHQLIGRFCPELGYICDVAIVSGGAEKVALLCSSFPKETPVCELIAILDGDKRISSTSLLFLPGDKDPIELAKDCENANSIGLSAAIGTTIGNVERCLRTIAGANHHDFCSDFARELKLPGIDTKRVRNVLIGAWLSSPEWQVHFERLADQLNERIAALPFSI